LLTGATIGWLGVRHALLLDGALAVGTQVLIGRYWRGRSNLRAANQVAWT
jgi:hypothetical protein